MSKKIYCISIKCTDHHICKIPNNCIYAHAPLKECTFNIIRTNIRTVVRAFMEGGGGGVFIYSCYARLISFEISCY